MRSLEADNENLFSLQQNSTGTQRTSQIQTQSSPFTTARNSTVKTAVHTSNISGDTPILSENNRQDGLPQQSASTLKRKNAKPQFGPGSLLFNSTDAETNQSENSQSVKISIEDDENVEREITPGMTRAMDRRLQDVEKPGMFRRALQQICGVGRAKSDDEDNSEASDISQPEVKKKKENSPEKKQKKPRAPSLKKKRSIKAAIAVQGREDNKITQTMTVEQKEVYDKAANKITALQNDVAEERKASTTLNKKCISLETSQNEMALALEKERSENVKNQLQIAQLLQENENLNKKLKKQEDTTLLLNQQLNTSKSNDSLIKDLQRQLQHSTQLLASATKTSEILSLGQEKLRQVNASTSAVNRKLEAQNFEADKQNEELKKNLKEMQRTLNAMNDVVMSALTYPKDAVEHKIEPVSRPHKSFEQLGERAQRQYVKELVDMIESETLLKERIVKRLVPKQVQETPKMTPNQAVALAVSIGLSQSKVEKLKSFLRLVNLDILPPMTSMRKLVKNFHNEYEYETFEDKEKGIYCRRAVSISKLIKLRIARLMESKNFEEIPGLEDYVIVGITADKGGGSIKVALSLCNVKNGKASPNDLTIIGVANAPKDDYDTFKFCFGKSFDEINGLDEKEIEIEVGGEIIKKKVLFVVCCDGKMMSCLSGHSGASSTNPCYCCEITKKEMNERKTAPLRNAAEMKEQALKFQAGSCSRAECKSITNPPICTIPYDRWVYGALHSVGGPAVAVLKKVEETALEADLDELGINVPSKKEAKAKTHELQHELNQIKHDIVEAERALKVSKILLKKWKSKSKSKSKVVSEPPKDSCNAKYCIKEIVNDNSLFSSCVSCESCNSFIHASCDLLVLSSEIETAQNEGYICSQCNGFTGDDLINDLKDRQVKWEESLKELKTILLEKEKSEYNLAIPYERCTRYQKIQAMLKELNVRKTRGFQTLNGIDIRRLVKNGDKFATAVCEEQEEAVKDVFSCLNKFQEFAKPRLLSDEEINSLDAEKLLNGYQKLCGDSITPKLHDLTDHTPRFMKKFHFYQFCSDQPIENAHSLSNYLLRSQTNAKRQDHTQLEAITNNFCLRNMLFDAGLNVGNLHKKSLEEKQAMLENLNQ